MTNDPSTKLVVLTGTHGGNGGSLHESYSALTDKGCILTKFFDDDVTLKNLFMCKDPLTKVNLGPWKMDVEAVDVGKYFGDKEGLVSAVSELQSDQFKSYHYIYAWCYSLNSDVQKVLNGSIPLIEKDYFDRKALFEIVEHTGSPSDWWQKAVGVGKGVGIGVGAAVGVGAGMGALGAIGSAYQQQKNEKLCVM